jgi:cysteine desulfurase
MLLEDARDRLAHAIKCNRSEVIFTSGGTESDNLAIKGLYWQRNRDAKRPLVVSTYTEHHGVIDPIEWLESHEGAEAIWLDVSEEGVVDLDALAALLAERGDEVALISLMWANNETGVITDIRRVSEIAAKYSVPVHSDAVAALGHVDIDFAASGLAAMSITGHKVGSPVGTGALVLSRGSEVTSLIHGGGQERGLRSGTMNYSGALAFAHAAELAVAEHHKFVEHTSSLIALLRAAVVQIEGSRFSIGSAPGMTHNAHFTFEGVKSDSVLFLLDELGIAVSAGSACQAGVARPSHVLLAMGRSETEASGCLRVTIGLETKAEDIESLIAALPGVIAQSRAAFAG